MKPFPLAVLALVGGAGCGVLAPDPQSQVLRGDRGSISIRELEQRTQNYADRYVQLIADAAEDIKQRTEKLVLRREAHLFKLRSATSAWDIVTSSHPLQEMLDLFVQTELEHLIWVEEGQARRAFGPDGGERIADALRSARREILALVLRAMDEKQIRDIRGLIRDWHRRNPSIETGAFVRFGPFLEAPGGTLVTQVLSGFGILDLSRLNPLDPAARKVGLVGEAANDVFYMAKRFPMLLQWQAEAASYDLFLNLDRATEGAPEVLEESRTLLQETAQAARALEGTFQALEKITNPEKDPEEKKKPPGRPFDIREYAAAVGQVERSARELRATIAEAREFTGSPVILTQIRELSLRAERLLAQLLVSGILLLLVFFVLLLAYRSVAAQLRYRRLRRRRLDAPVR